MRQEQGRPRRVVYISGPVASGKTTLAFGLASMARTRGLQAAAIDVDDLVAVVAGSDWSKVTPADRRLSWRLARSIAEWLLDERANVIAIAGSTLSAEEAAEALLGLAEKASIAAVRLRVSLAEAIRRAGEDASRGVTRRPEVVTRLHEAVDWSRMAQPDFEVDTDGLSTEEVATFVWRAIVEGSSDQSVSRAGERNFE